MSVSPRTLIDEAPRSTPSSQGRAHRLWRRVVNIFAPVESPYNLAVFRIVLFASILLAPELYAAPKYAAQSPALMLQYPDLAWMPKYLPIDPAAAHIAVVLLIVCCIAASIGLFTRASAIMVTLLATYVFGLRELFGSVNHVNNHLVWFAAMLAVSPCADVLSMDKIIESRRKGKSGAVAGSFNSRIYSLPLRLVWILMGIIYFFPGFWKLNMVGLKWAFSDNIQRLIYKAVFMSGGQWHPIFPIDRYPMLCELGALGVMFFEISFIALIFVPALRLYVAAAGLMFHTMTHWFLNIHFTVLQCSYAAFVDWHGMCRRLGKNFLPRGWTQPPSQTVSPKVSQILPVLIVGLSIIAANVWYGVRKNHFAWPFACYPIFDRIPPDTLKVLTIEAYDKDGKPIGLAAVERRVSAEQHPTTNHAVPYTRSKARQDRWLEALWRCYVQKDPSLAEASPVRFYEDTVNIFPEHQRENPVKRKLLLELKPGR
jgi:hypothetical protein